MKTLILSLLVGLVLSACGRGTNSPAMVDQTFQPYFTLFENEARAHGQDVTTEGIEIYFGDTGNPMERATCKKDFNQHRRIIVNPTWWTASLNQREALIFHELGHCVLNLEHNDEMEMVHGSFVPVSLMNSVLVSGTVYQDRREDYLERLFK